MLPLPLAGAPSCAQALAQLSQELGRLLELLAARPSGPLSCSQEQQRVQRRQVSTFWLKNKKMRLRRIVTFFLLFLPGYGTILKGQDKIAKYRVIKTIII